MRLALHEFLRGLASWHAARFAIQATASALVTFALAQLLGLTEISWAIISALFAVHATVGGSLSSAVDRVLGAVLGAVVGLLVVVTIGYGDWRSVAGIGIGVALTSWVIGVMPGLQYGLVTVAILAVAPGSDPIVDALHKIAAIALGALVASVCSAVIFPVRAHRGAERQMCLAAKRCCELLDASTKVLLGGEACDVERINDDIRSHVSQAQSLTAQSQVLRLHRWGRSRPTPRQMLRSVERLWYTLALVDRLSAQQLPRLDPERLERPVAEALKACCGYLHELAEAMASNATVSSPEPVSRKISAMRDALGDVCDLGKENDLTSHDRERLFAFSFAWEQIDQTICDIARLMQVDEKRSRARDRVAETPHHDVVGSSS